MFFFFWFFGSSSSSSASVQRRPLLCRGEALCLAALAGWASCGFFLSGFATRTDGASVRLALNGGKGGFVLWCCAVAGLRGRGVHALPVWLPIHCTIFPALQPVIRPPYYYILFTSSSVHPAQKRSPREVDLGIDIWLSGCASWKRLAEAETASQRFSSVSRLPELCDLAQRRD